jgi:two-component system cell cycle response regulator
MDNNNNPLPESNSCQNRPLVSVLPLGFEAADVERLKRIFQTAPQGNYHTAIQSGHGENIDILLVNYDNPAALVEKDAILKSNPHIPVVAASRGPLKEPVDYHIRGLLMASRVLSVLDKVPAGGPAPTASPQPSAGPSAVEAGAAPSPGHETVHPVLPKPRPVADAPETPPSITIPATQAAHGYRALVVDDSTAMQKSLELNLAALEQIAAIDFADDGESALEKVENTHYDLIFLDVMMPGIDGYETCSRLRKKPEYKKTPIIMVSGKTSPMDEVKGVIAGCTTYVTKPIQKEEFQKLGSRVLAWLANYQPREHSSH